MLNLKNTGTTFYSTKVTFLDDGVERVVYTDSPSQYQVMANEFKERITNMVTENFTPTEEMVERLNILNQQGMNKNMEGYGQQLNLFVEFGYLGSDAPEYMQRLINKYSASSKAYLISKYKKLLSAYKTEKEVGGCKFQDHNIKTDAESQAKITSTLMMLNTGVINNVDFKTADGFINLDTANFTKMAVTVAMHVQCCFKAEAVTIENLEKMTLLDLETYNPDKSMIGTKQEQEEAKLNNIYNLYDVAYTDLVKKALAAQEPSTSTKAKSK